MKKLKKKNQAINPEIVEDAEYSLNVPMQEKNSKLPFVNKFNEKNTRSFRKVIQEKTGLANDLRSLGFAIGNLRDIDIEIETESLNKKNNFAKALRELNSQKNENKIKELKQQLKIAQLQAELEETKNPQPKVKPEDDELEEYRKQAKVDAEKRKIEIEKRFGLFKEELQSYLKKQEISDLFEKREKENCRKKICQKYGFDNVDDLEFEIQEELNDCYEKVEAFIHNVSDELG